jgi:transcription elongation factor SPT6
VLREAVTTLLFPRIEREIKATLMKEGLDAVLAKCGNHLRSKLFRAPFKSDRVGVDEGSGIQVVSIIPGDAAGKEQMPTYAVLLGPDGDMVDFLRLDWFMTSKRSIGAHAAKRAQDWDDLREFLHRNQPDAMVIGAIDLNSQRVHRDIVEWLAEAAQAADRGEEEPLPNIAVEYGEMQMARLFASSPRSLEEFPDHDIRVRQAISLARRFQNSEREFAAAFNQDNEILSIAWHPLQSMTRTEDLIRTLEQEVITAVNGAGVDLNLCLNHPASAAMLPFVAGFGPRKAAELLKQVTLAKRVEGGLVRIFTREHLMLYKEHIGSTVLWISSGFLYTPPDEQGGNDLDRTRVHPESYR